MSELHSTIVKQILEEKPRPRKKIKIKNKE